MGVYLCLVLYVVLCVVLCVVCSLLPSLTLNSPSPLSFLLSVLLFHSPPSFLPPLDYFNPEVRNHMLVGGGGVGGRLGGKGWDECLCVYLRSGFEDSLCVCEYLPLVTT